MPDQRNPIRSFPARLVAGKVLLVAVLAAAVTEFSIVLHADAALASLVHASTAGWLTDLLFAVSKLASSGFILAVMALAAGFLVARRHWHGAAALVVSVVATQALVGLAKPLVERPRPEGDAAMVEPSGFSFPSAHSASAVALYLMLALIAASLFDRRLRTVAYLGAGAVVALVGLSRIYLGAHYPTDVLAGWLTGAIVVVASWRLCAGLPAPSRVAV
jgi:membrane-associated phospholipid phosphatase